MDMTHWKFQILLPVCMLLLGCGQNSTDKASDVAVIEIVQHLGEYHAIPISRFTTELEYIPLETNDDCLEAGNLSDMIVTSTHIFVWGSRFCYAFDRNGRFLGKIGNVGQGPGEYSVLGGLSVDEKKQSLYLDARTLLEYSWDGVFRQSIVFPENEHGYSPQNVVFVRDNLFIGCYNNYSGVLSHNFILFDQSSEVVKLFDNYVEFHRPYIGGWWADRSIKPYRIGERVYVKEVANDTLFCLNEQNELIPQFVFNIGQFTSTKEKREADISKGIRTEELIVSYNGRHPVTGTQNYLFFGFAAFNLSGKYPFPEDMDGSNPRGLDWHNLAGIYDTANQTTQLLDADPVSHMVGMINDLDGGLSFYPKYYTSDNEMIDIWWPAHMKRYLTESYFAAHEIKNPEAHQKLKELLQKLNEEDNPVIVIAKLKPDLITSNK